MTRTTKALLAALTISLAVLLALLLVHVRPGSPDKVADERAQVSEADVAQPRNRDSGRDRALGAPHASAATNSALPPASQVDNLRPPTKWADTSLGATVRESFDRWADLNHVSAEQQQAVLEVLGDARANLRIEVAALTLDRFYPGHDPAATHAQLMATDLGEHEAPDVAARLQAILTPEAYQEFCNRFGGAQLMYVLNAIEPVATPLAW